MYPPWQTLRNAFGGINNYEIYKTNIPELLPKGSGSFLRGNFSLRTFMSQSMRILRRDPAVPLVEMAAKSACIRGQGYRREDGKERQLAVPFV
jgi:hypothetical protein